MHINLPARACQLHYHHTNELVEMLAFFCGHMDIYFYVFILANLLTYKIVFEHSRKTTQNVVKLTISSKYLEQVYLRFPFSINMRN